MRIEILELKAKNLVSMKQFYGDVLGLPSELTGSKLTIHLQDSDLIFHQAETSDPYHFAFNIFENQIADSCEWLKERCEILPGEDGEEIVDFPNWNAEAVYFLDPESNILEFIARHELENASTEPFSAKSIYSVSEIGCCGGQIPDDFEVISNAIGIEKYSGDFERFCAAGDAHGLLIMVTANRNWYPTQIPSIPSDFRARVSHKGKTADLRFEQRKLKLVNDLRNT